jgi:hypothetical protein
LRAVEGRGGMQELGWLDASCVGGMAAEFSRGHSGSRSHAFQQQSRRAGGGRRAAVGPVISTSLEA